MEGERAQRSLDHRIAAVASRQGGVVSRAQLRDLGVSNGGVDARVERGRLHVLHRGVYAVGHAVVGVRGRRLAAVLAAGPGAVLSHRTAADEWGLRASDAAGIEITIPTRNGRRTRAGIRVHRAALAEREATIRDRLPITTPARTLVDVAEVVTRRALERAVDAAESLELFDLGAVEAVLAAHPHRHGAARLRHVLASYEIGEALTRSELEERVLAICRAADVPRPAVNARAAGLDVDFLWRDARLVVEADSRRHHHTLAAFERDRERDAQLVARGYRVIRLTHRRVVTRPGEVGRLLAQAAAGTAVRAGGGAGSAKEGGAMSR
jgi:hypothetical protein